MRSLRIPISISIALLAGSVGSAHAQGTLTSQQGMQGIGSEGTFGSPSLHARGDDTGVRLGNSSLLHVGVTADGGYDTNVFYLNEAPRSSPFLRVTPFLELSNATRDNQKPSGVYYNLAASLAYREY